MSHIAKGNACIVGDIHVVDDPESQGSDGKPYEIKKALVIQFDDTETIRKAMNDGKCEFTVFGE